jgi:hypothetical protein
MTSKNQSLKTAGEKVCTHDKYYYCLKTGGNRCRSCDTLLDDNGKLYASQPQEQGAQEKAMGLYNKFLFAGIHFTDGNNGAAKNAKSCAIICVDEQIATINKLLDTELNNDFSLLSERGELLSVRSYIQEM